MNTDYYVVIPNWNGIDLIEKCLESLRAQTVKHGVIVVDNGSVDGSNHLIREKFPEVELLEFPNNAGFAGGVNRGIRPALEHGAKYIALLNNDAVAEPTWLQKLVEAADANPRVGAVAAKILTEDGKRLDSSGDLYSVWGLPFPRGRDEEDGGQYDREDLRHIFAASGGASLYRAEMLKQIGLFDERFFAYFEDSDIGFRGQLAGWQTLYEPAARVYHYIGGTSSRMDTYGKEDAATSVVHKKTAKPSPFARYHSVKNIVFLYTKDMPGRLYWKYLPRFWLSLILLMVNDASRGLLGSYIKGLLLALVSLPSILISRRQIQRKRTVSIKYIDSILYPKLPPLQKKKVAEVKNIYFLLKPEKLSSRKLKPRGRLVVLALIIIGIAARFMVANYGHNFDFDSYKIVAGITDHLQNVYAFTDRYNYGPIWFNILHVFSWLAHHTSSYDSIFRYEIIGLLTSADLIISWILYRRFGWIAGVLFFLNPISIAITGYHNQFDNLAIAIGLIAILYLEKSKKRPPLSKDLLIGCGLLGLSLSTKHIFFVFPLWIAYRQKGIINKLVALMLPVLIFALSFAPYWRGGSDGIINNVINYKSNGNSPFYNFILPPFVHFIVSPMTIFLVALVIAGYLTRKMPLFTACMWYLLALVILSPSITNQYLAIVMPAVAGLYIWPAIPFVYLASNYIWFVAPEGVQINGPFDIRYISPDQLYGWMIFSLFIGVGLHIYREPVDKFITYIVPLIRSKATELKYFLKLDY